MKPQINSQFKLTLRCIFSFLLSAAIMEGCVKEEVIPFENLTDNLNGNKKPENPFTVLNMQKAYNNLKKNNANGRSKELEIRATHLYVRFLPKDIEQYDILISDTTLFLEEYPIDYKREITTDFYHDPSIPDSLPTYQYTAVPVGYVSPSGISMEILAELYLPKADGLLASPNGKISSEFEDVVDELEYEAFLITNNLTNDEKKSNAGRAAG